MHNAVAQVRWRQNLIGLFLEYSYGAIATRKESAQLIARWISVFGVHLPARIAPLTNRLRDSEVPIFFKHCCYFLAVFRCATP